MKIFFFLSFVIASVFFTSCSSDPCDDIANVECASGDIDGDGVLNGEDTAPEDPCVPNSLAITCPDADTDGDGVLNGEDAAPEDPCVPSIEVLVCGSGDADADGIVNMDDSDPEDACLPSQNNLACPTGDVDGDGVSNADDAAPADPCVPNENVLVCPTGDFDADGVPNGEDINPVDPCIPNAPPFSENVVGSWSWDQNFEGGRVKINADGTYLDLSNALVSNGQVVKRNWSISNGRMKFEVENADGFKASINMKWTDYGCNSITFDGEGFGNIYFSRI